MNEPIKKQNITQALGRRKTSEQYESLLFHTSTEEEFLLMLYNRSKFCDERVVIEDREIDRLSDLANFPRNQMDINSQGINKRDLLRQLDKAGIQKILSLPNVKPLGKIGIDWYSCFKLVLFGSFALAGGAILIGSVFRMFEWIRIGW